MLKNYLEHFLKKYEENEISENVKNDLLGACLVANQNLIKANVLQISNTDHWSRIWRNDEFDTVLSKGQLTIIWRSTFGTITGRTWSYSDTHVKTLGVIQI